LTVKAYEEMRFRDALKHGFYEPHITREDYKLHCGSFHMKKNLAMKYMYLQLLLLFPICPHTCEMLY
jgi:leucyl-tRNA synthetase